MPYQGIYVHYYISITHCADVMRRSEYATALEKRVRVVTSDLINTLIPQFRVFLQSTILRHIISRRATMHNIPPEAPSASRVVDEHEHQKLAVEGIQVGDNVEKRYDAHSHDERAGW